MELNIQILTELNVWATLCKSNEHFYQYVVNSLLDKYEKREFRVVDENDNILEFERF